jgi:uncharacterized membrane protein (Fun14 family)
MKIRPHIWALGLVLGLLGILVLGVAYLQYRRVPEVATQQVEAVTETIPEKPEVPEQTVVVSNSSVSVAVEETNQFEVITFSVRPRFSSVPMPVSPTNDQRRSN